MAIKTVETFRRIRDEHHRQTKDLTPDQRRQFYKQKAEASFEKAKRLSKHGNRS
jgi:hypothetical protein